MGKGRKIKLQVQLVAFRQEGVERLVAHTHPRVEGVRWLVAVQTGGDTIHIPPELSARQDFDIIVNDDRGHAKNRNHALDFDCDSELILFGDDDVDYYADSLRRLMAAFDTHADIDMICARYRCNGGYVKNYGDGEFSLARPPFGWYVATFEMAVRRDALGTIRFNEKMRVGDGGLVCGEDSIFLADMLRAGRKGLGIPLDLCAHNQPTSGERLATDPRFFFAYGACLTHIKPISWLPRLVLQAHRTPAPFGSSLITMLRGAHHAFKHRIFK